MRVTEQMVISDFLRNISKTRQSIDVLNRQLASNNKISKPSDDPFIAEAIMRYQSAIEKNGVYQKNVANAITYLETSFNSIDGVISTLTDLKVLITAASNTEEPGMLETYGNEAEGILQRLINYGNTKFNNKYIFGGSNTTTVPYLYDGNKVTISSKGTGGEIYVDLGGPDLEVINTNGDDVFLGTEIFDFVVEIRDRLKNLQPPTTEHLNKIDDYINNANVQ